MTRFTLLIFILSIGLLHSCSSPEDQLVGIWEYDSYEIDPSGVGALSQFLPESMKSEVDNYIEKLSNFSKGRYIFNADGTYESSFSGFAEDLTSQSGYFSVSPDSKSLTLKAGNQEKQSELLELSSTHFTQVWELKEYQLPLKINLRYRKVIMN